MDRRRAGVTMGLLFLPGVLAAACGSGPAAQAGVRSGSPPWDVGRLAGLTDYTFASTFSSPSGVLTVTGRVADASDFEVDTGGVRSVVVRGVASSASGGTAVTVPLPPDYFHHVGEWVAATQFVDIAEAAGETVEKGAACMVAGIGGSEYVEGTRTRSGRVTVAQEACVASGTGALLSLEGGAFGAGSPAAARPGRPVVAYGFRVTSVGTTGPIVAP